MAFSGKLIQWRQLISTKQSQVHFLARIFFTEKHAFNPFSSVSDNVFAFVAGDAEDAGKSVV